MNKNKIILVIVIAFIGLLSIYFLHDDNPIEETCEQVIEQNIGIELDLSPNSPEQQDK